MGNRQRLSQMSLNARLMLVLLLVGIRIFSKLLVRYYHLRLIRAS